MENSKKPSGILIAAIVISLFVGAAAGAVFGILGSQIVPWFTEEEQADSILKSLTREVENESATIDAIDKVSDSVVSIIASGYLSDYYYYDPYYEYYGEGEEMQEIGGGTGVIISEDGLVLTNKHVIEDDTAEYSIVLDDGTKYDEVEIVSADPFNDLAILRIKGVSGLPVAELGDSGALKIGQTVLAIGNVLSEYDNSATKGIISGLGREIIAEGGLAAPEQLDTLIQTDAPINPGNSGGPLINLQGQVIGINVAVDWAGQSIGFAIPINAAKSAIESVKEHGRIVRPMLGVRYVPINKKVAEENNLADDHGVLVVRGENPAQPAVLPGSPADKAGIEENDIILEVEGQKIDQENELPQLMREFSVGDTIKLKIMHDGEEKAVEATLVEMGDNL